MKRVSVFLLAFLIVSLVLPLYQIPKVKAQEEKVFGNPTLPDWLNVSVTEYSANIIVDNGDGFVWEFPKDKDKFNQIYENGTLIVKDEQWLLIGEDLKEDSHPIGKLEWEQPEPYHVIVKDYYQDVKKNNNFTVTYSFYGGFHPKITFNASIGTEGNYTVDWRCWLYKDNGLHETEEHRVKFWNANEMGVVFNYEDVYMSFGNITESDVTGWFKGKRFDEKFNVGFLNGTFMLDPSFGKTDIGGTNISKGAQSVCSRFTLSEDGIVSKLTIYGRDQWEGVNCRVKAAIYDVVGGLPVNLQGAETVEVTPPAAYDWFDLVFAVPVELVAADYFLCWNAGPPGWSLFSKYDPGTANYYKETACLYADFPENPYGVPDWSGDYLMSIYATYTPSVGEYSEEFSESIGISTSLYLWKALSEKYVETTTVTATSYGWKEKSSFYMETTTITTQTNKWHELNRFFTETITITETSSFAKELLLEIVEFTELIQVDATMYLTTAIPITITDVYGLAALALILAIVAVTLVVSKK